MRAYARLTGRRRKISPRVSSRRKLLPSREEAGGGKSSSLPLSLSLPPPSLSSSLLHAGICALNGKEEENFSSLSPVLFPLLASPRDGNYFRREKRREEESLPLSRSSLSRALPLSRLPPSSYLGDAEPAAGYLPIPEAAPQRQLKSRAPPPLSLLPRDLIFFPWLTRGGQVAFVLVNLRRGLHVDAHWTKILPCQQLG